MTCIVAEVIPIKNRILFVQHGLSQPEAVKTIVCITHDSMEVLTV